MLEIVKIRKDISWLIEQIKCLIKREEGQAGTGLITEDIPVVLSGTKTLGKYVNGQTILSTGKTVQEVLKDIALEYIQPVFNSFSILSQPTTVEVGTTLSGSKTFNWSISQNSGVVPKIDIYNNSISATVVADITNNGTYTVPSILTALLASEGDTQSWKGIANNTAPISTINSANFVVTARYYRWFGPSATEPTDRASALLLPNNAFQTSAVTTFTLVTGITQLKMIILLPPGVIINTIQDTTNNANLTSDYVFSTVTINDARNVATTYNRYILTLGAPYTISANHVITTKAI